MGACFDPNHPYVDFEVFKKRMYSEYNRPAVEAKASECKKVIITLRNKNAFIDKILKMANINFEDIQDTIISEWILNCYMPDENTDWISEVMKALNPVDLFNVLKIIGHDLLFDIKEMINDKIDLETIADRIVSKDKYIGFKEYDIPMYWIVEQVANIQNDEWQQIINNKNTIINNFKNKTTEASAAKDFNPNAFLEKPVVQQNIMQPVYQAPQQVQQPVYQAPQPQQQTPQLQYNPGSTAKILSYNPINPLEYNGFYGLFIDKLNNQVHLPVARPQYSSIESSFGCLLDDSSSNNDATKIIEFLRKHVKFINPGKNNFTLTEALSLVNLVKNNAKIKEYCEKYESIYNPSSIILNEVTDKYILKGTKFNKAFSIDTQDADHPIIVFYNTKPYYNGIINGWINESAITVKK